ncbi:MAG: hypothetical protein HQK79_13470 [Desulfobacterales bacterium]|nr:hypothetical protein [Desulfobacterales bacterium]MBF0395977.1 hypothetical protein [Desulfobacterales bacterium]
MAELASRQPKRKGVFSYQCKRCGATTQSPTLPGASECPNGGIHEWSKITQVGGTPYQCQKCGATIPSRTIPPPAGCPLGKYHLWKQIGGR